MVHSDSQEWTSRILQFLSMIIGHYRDLSTEVEAYRYRIVVDSIACLSAIVADLYLEAIDRVATSDPGVRKRVFNAIEKAVLNTFSKLLQSPSKAIIGAFLRQAASVQEVMAEVATQLDRKYSIFDEVYTILSKARKLSLPRALPYVSISILVGIALFFLMPLLYIFLSIPLFTDVTYIAIASALVPLATISWIMLNAYSKRAKAQELLQKLKLVCKEYLEP